MSLRQKLLLAQAPLAIALIVVGIFGIGTTVSLRRSSEDILRENYRSVLAAQRMKDAAERLQDRAANLLVSDSSALGGDAERQLFEAELAVESGNLTEPGEGPAVERLRERWHRYRADLQQLAELSGREVRLDAFRQRLESSFGALRTSVDEILVMNQDAIVHKSDRALRNARQANLIMIVVALFALVLGAAGSATATGRVLQPLAALSATVNRIGEGNFAARVEIAGNDELAQLGRSVNGMAAHIDQYRRSSLGELLLAQQASQAAIDSLPDPVVVFDLGGAVLNVNRAAEEVLGLTLAADASAALDSLDSGARAAIDRVRGHVLAGKGPFVTKGFDDAIRVGGGDSERYLLPRATPVYSEQGSVSGAAVVLQDITRLRRVDELRNDLVATVAHELRTPLTSLRMAIHMLIEHAAGPLTERQGALLYGARDDCERLQSTVDELLDLARIQGGQVQLRLRTTLANWLIETSVEAVRRSAEERELHLTAETIPGLGEVDVDRERIHVVFANLLNNAIRHTPPAGSITVRGRAQDGKVRFEVSDTGPGIAPEFHHVIFEKFTRVPGAAAGGAGLGLPIAKEIVEAHGGEIGVDSTPGAGATFWFTIPAGAGQPGALHVSLS